MGEQWHTYQTVADALGVKVNSVRARRRRGNWQHRISNETGKAEVYVDLDALVERKEDVAPSTTTIRQEVVTPSQPSRQSEEDQERLREMELMNATLAAKLEATEGMVKELRERIEELRSDHKEDREVIAGLLQVLQEDREPPRSWWSLLFGGGRR
jgi:chromosome segregation ATPase